MSGRIDYRPLVSAVVETNEVAGRIQRRDGWLEWLVLILLGVAVGAWVFGPWLTS